jgi:hypothetical protein
MEVWSHELNEFAVVWVVEIGQLARGSLPKA